MNILVMVRVLAAVAFIQWMLQMISDIKSYGWNSSITDISIEFLIIWFVICILATYVERQERSKTKGTDDGNI